MSFVNKIKGWGQKNAPADSEPMDGDVAVADHFDPSVEAAPVTPSSPDLALPDVDIEAGSAFDAEPGVHSLAPSGGSMMATVGGRMSSTVAGAATVRAGVPALATAASTSSSRSTRSITSGRRKRSRKREAA